MADLIAAGFFSFLEFVFPGSSPRYFKRKSGALQDVLWYATNEGMRRLLSRISFLALLPAWRFHPFSASWLQHTPLLVQFLIAFLLVDFCTWITHYIIHRTPVLWRFHKLHHSSESMDWLAGFRSYWLDSMTVDLLGGLPLLLIPFDPRVGAVLGFWLLLVTFVAHTNLKFRPPWISEWLTTWPSHRVHHLVTLHHPYGQNFGILTLIWDHVFGTYVSDLNLTGKTVYGLPRDEYYPRGYFARLIYPFLPRALAARLDRSLP